MNYQNLYVNKKNDAFKHSKSCVRFFLNKYFTSANFLFQQTIGEADSIHFSRLNYIGLMITFTFLHIFNK